MNTEYVRFEILILTSILLHHLQNILITFPPDATEIHLCVCKCIYVCGWKAIDIFLWIWCVIHYRNYKYHLSEPNTWNMYFIYIIRHSCSTQTLLCSAHTKLCLQDLRSSQRHCSKFMSSGILHCVTG